MNKRHYEHTLPNIRGSLSNTYKHYNGATMPGAGLCNATQARTFATTVCFNGLFTPKKRQDEPDSKTGKK